MSYTITESRKVDAEYNMQAEQVIMDTPDGRRLLIVQGYCGECEMRGGAIRWNGGSVYQLQTGDTFERLDNEPWNEGVTLMQAVLGNHDDTRPLQLWDGQTIENLMTSTEITEQR